MQKRQVKEGPPPAKIDVGLLVRRAQAGDVRSFEELVVIYQDRIYNLSYYLAGNQADAQDLAQETFVRAYTSLKSFRRDADLGTWLHRITVNLWLNVRRRRKNAQVLSLDDPVETDRGEVTRTLAAVDPAGDPVEALEGKELQARVREALRSLPEEYRTVLVLREMEGYSYAEIAGLLRCSLGTVKSRLSRARQALKERFKPVRSEPARGGEEYGQQGKQ